MNASHLERITIQPRTMRSSMFVVRLNTDLEIKLLLPYAGNSFKPVQVHVHQLVILEQRFNVRPDVC